MRARGPRSRLFSLGRSPFMINADQNRWKSPQLSPRREQEVQIARISLFSGILPPPPLNKTALHADINDPNPQKLIKKIKLTPLTQRHPTQVTVKTKAGTNGKIQKINQDLAIVDQNLPFGIKLFMICDGHGIYGHLVVAFIRYQLLKHLQDQLKFNAHIIKGFEQALRITTDLLLNSDIDTQLSGTTMVAILIHRQKLYCFNVGDSRAIITSEANGNWKVDALSNDQKPERKDEADRIISAGGRIAQQLLDGTPVGPLRVWMKDKQSPGLAMTRSLGDKAGQRAGVISKPELEIVTLGKEHRFIVLASDGVWECLSNQEILDAVIPFFLERNIEGAGEKIIKMSVDLWRKFSLSRDDITVIVIYLGHNRTSQLSPIK